MIGIKICATGRYLPGEPIHNEAFTSIVETSDEWIRTRTGICCRHIADGDTTWHMGAAAAKSALQDGGIDPERIDLIIASSLTGDYATPSLSCLIQKEIGAQNAMCIDINCACSGFVYALDMARRYLACGDVDTVLIVASEMLSRITDYTDRSTCVLFGDGAGACIVKAAEKLFASHLGADGTGYDLLYSKNDPPASPFTKKPLIEDAISKTDRKPHSLFMDGREVYKFSISAMPHAVRKACEKAGITPEQLDYIVPHQANVRIVQTAMKALKLPMEKAVLYIDKYGITSSASIPIALDALCRSKQVKAGEKLCVVGFGAGLTYGAAVIEC